MKKQSIGLGLLLMGNIIAQFQELAAWMFGVMLGVAGLIVLFYGVKEE